jgi:methionine-S-sulfoxide reductase
MRYAYFAGGCFWCIQPVFDSLDSVISVICGYCGGSEDTPSYEEVKSQKTGHRETVRIEYDEEKITFSSLLRTFFDAVDVSDGGGQFIDRGRSYTLAVYYTDEEEKKAAESAVSVLGCENTVAIEALRTFYPAEEYHQDYYKKEPEKFACELNLSGRIKRKKEKNMQRVFEFLRDAGTYYLATDDNGQPRVRPFGTVNIFDGRLYIQTGKKKAVSAQLHKNPKAEICAFNKGLWIRITCELIEDDRYEAKKSMLDAYPDLRGMYDENDGNTEVFYCKDAVAVISSFSAPPEVIRF